MGAVTLSSVLKVHPETGALRVDGRWAAASPDGGYHTFEDEAGVSEVGERIMDLIDGQRSVQQIVEVLCHEFDIDPTTCGDETLRFCTLLVQKQVLSL